MCLKLHMSFTGFILCLITGCSLLPSAVCLLSQILLNSNFPHFSTKLTNFDSISWKQTNSAKAHKTWVITNICQRNSCYLWTMRLNMWSYRGIHQIHESYRWARIDKFLRQKCRIYKFLRQKCRIYTFLRQKCRIYKFLR